MTADRSRQQRASHLVLSLLRWLEKFRYLKFGIVGASGTVVNLAVLYVGHEYIFHAIESTYKKPYFSLALAISLATVNNFTWNRLWTWSDRVKVESSDSTQANQASNVSILKEFGQYATASGFGSALQYGLTLLLSGSMDYRLANITAIVIASVSNFLANDRWTFRRR
ncbi:MAG: polysaccharide synthesis protein GtrA [Burkholderiales bacterium PBB4]|nr:MAG: polysaccharide synthesis protein GtrA [Burkholderiales bacterium PBB4]